MQNITSLGKFKFSDKSDLGQSEPSILTKPHKGKTVNFSDKFS